MLAFIYIATLVAVAAFCYLGYGLHVHKVNHLKNLLELEEMTSNLHKSEFAHLHELVTLLYSRIDTADRLSNQTLEANGKLATTVAAMTTTHEMLITEIEERNKELAYVLLGSIDEQLDDQPIPFVLTDEPLFPAPAGTDPRPDLQLVHVSEDVGLPVNPITTRTWGERMSDLGVDDASIGRLLDEVKPDDN